MNQSNIAVTIYATSIEAEAVIKDLKQSGFMKKLWIVGRHYLLNYVSAPKSTSLSSLPMERS